MSISKVQLLMEETGCDEGEAELALEMCGYEVEAAVKALPRLLKNIAVLKAKFRHSVVSGPQAGTHQFGLLLVIANIKSNALLRCRAVLSYNPAVYGASLDKDWFEFERFLYGCRLWDGSVPAESLEIEHAIAQHFRQGLDPKLFSAGEEGVRQAGAELGQVLGRLLRLEGVEVKLKSEVLDLGQFQSLETKPSQAPPMRRPAPSPSGSVVSASAAGEAHPGVSRSAETLVLKVSLEEAGDGVEAEALQPGDLVNAFITDGRDIAQYIAKLLGCPPDGGPAAILAPVESVDPGEGGRVVRVRFAAGVCGEAVLAGDAKYKVQSKDSREALKFQESVPWWRKLFK
ncbi:MAG: hypothetical protein HY924_12230 [Elusimicrobia bacterium]|nr:hypothetical protein [Elusimicrobiota bacterium]